MKAKLPMIAMVAVGLAVGGGTGAVFIGPMVAKKMGKSSISSQAISEYTNVNPTQIRRDLSGFGKFGKRGVGYDIDSLIEFADKVCGRSR